MFPPVCCRVSVCSQVLKTILDKIEREEKKEQKQARRAESAEERQKRLAVSRSQHVLYKHKEALKREIQRKRQLNEQAMQMEIQVSILKNNWYNTLQNSLIVEWKIKHAVVKIYLVMQMQSMKLFNLQQAQVQHRLLNLDSCIQVI